MIAYLQGKVIFKKGKFIILDVNNVGYKVFLSQKNLGQINEEKPIKLFSFLYVRENSLDLYGFLTWQELELFESVNTISGVGPRAALEISSLGPLEKLKKTIEEGDGKIFEGIPGIGPKKARKIISEFSGRIKEENKEENFEDPAMDALNNLGFSRQKIKEVLIRIDKNKQIEERIKEALKIIKN